MTPPSREAQQPTLVAGIAGAHRNAAAALWVDGRIVACEQERVTRARNIGVLKGGFPEEALEAVLAVAGRARGDIAVYVAAEDTIELPADHPHRRFDHHYGHAAAAFYTSPFDRAAVLVCDQHATSEVSCWRADRGSLVRCDWCWKGPGLSRLYSEVTNAFGLVPRAEEHRLEAIARVGIARCVERARRLVCYRGDRLEVDPGFAETVRAWIGEGGTGDRLEQVAEIASAIQRHLGDLMVEMLCDIRARCEEENLCLGGGLFFNTYFNTRIEQSGLYCQTFVPVNPGNAGLAIGSVVASAPDGQRLGGGEALSAYLGPEYSAHAIKAVLDNCKLSYEYAEGGPLIERTVDALARGQLVGWFQGPMEWGPRALGNRSILANPAAPHVLENLNGYLKQREPYRTYGVSICEEHLDRAFSGPAASPFMQFEHEVRDPERFKALLPFGGTRLRVHTVGSSPPLFRAVLKAFATASGIDMLINTSFNGFREPIVCTPRDAVRVFYGTGLDVLVLGNFILRK